MKKTLILTIFISAVIFVSCENVVVTALSDDPILQEETLSLSGTSWYMEVTQVGKVGRAEVYFNSDGSGDIEMTIDGTPTGLDDMFDFHWSISGNTLSVVFDLNLDLTIQYPIEITEDLLSFGANLAIDGVIGEGDFPFPGTQLNEDSPIVPLKRF